MLYIGVKEDKTAFKVGITIDENFNRPIGLSKKYHNFNLEESYIVRANDEDVLQKLETQIKTDYKLYKIEFEEYVDGKGEFLDIQVLEQVLEDIAYKCKKNHLGMTITKGISRPKKLKEPSNNEKWFPKTFNVYEVDYSFFQSYSVHMGYLMGKKYNLTKCFNDAMNLLREKYPEIEAQRKKSGNNFF